MERDGVLRIGELSKRTGVSPELLRAWERRYGLLQPLRSAGGLRLYSRADVERVGVMQGHLADGLAAADIYDAPGGIGRQGIVLPDWLPLDRRRIDQAHDALHEVIDIGEVALHSALTVNLDRFVGQNRTNEFVERHVGPSPGAVYGE